VLWKETNEAIGDLSRLTNRPDDARYFSDQPRQLLDRLRAGQRRKPAGLLPRIEAKASEGRDHAQGNSIDLVPDCCEQKFVQIGAQWAEGPAQCHYAEA
jgi:hypothetical protein